MEHGLKHKGFTLLEVMMALLIVSIGLVALVQSGQYSANTLVEAKQKTMAYHVADQVMLMLYQKPDLSLGLHQGEHNFNGERFYWKAQLSVTENQSINRLDVTVGVDRQVTYAQAQLSGFKRS